MSDLVLDIQNEDGSVTTEFTSYISEQDTSLRTSEEWIQLKEYSHITLMDPDGWDRRNFDYSFKEEKINKTEFNRRLTMSTCMFKKKD